jgi:hypothetical protein
VDPPERVGEHDGERGDQEEHPVDRLDQTVEDAVGEGDQRHRGNEGKERAPGPEGEREAREDRRPDGGDGREHEGIVGGRRRYLDARFLADLRGSVSHLTEGLEGRRPEPGGCREDDDPDRHDQQGCADSRGEQEAPAFEDPRHQGGGDAHREQAVRRAVPDEHASEREANGDRDQLDRDEGRQTLDASSRSRGTCHRSLNFVDGVKTRQSQPARVRASLASVARASNWVRRLAGAVAGSTGWIKIASLGPNPEPDRMSCGSSWGAGGAAMNTSEASAEAAPRRLVRALESDGPFP